MTEEKLEIISLISFWKKQTELGSDKNETILAKDNSANIFSAITPTQAAHLSIVLAPILRRSLAIKTRGVPIESNYTSSFTQDPQPT